MLTLNFLYMLFITILSTIVLMYIMIKRKWILANPTNRGLHEKSVPSSGGIAIFVGYLISYLFIVNDILSENVDLVKVNDMIIIFSLFLICFLGLLDDKFKLSKFIRFSSQIIISVVIASMFNYTTITTLIYIGLIVYFINSYNFMDGIDSLAVSQAIFMILSLLFITGEIMISPIVLLSILAVFLFYNTSLSKIFLGNSGSYFLGLYIIIFFTILEDQDKITLLNSLILYTVFLVDTIYTIIVRFSYKIISDISDNKTFFNSLMSSLTHITQAHCTHNYQQLTKKNNSHSKTVLLLMSFNIFWCLPLAVISYEVNAYQWPLLLLSCLPYIFWCYKNKAGWEIK